MKNSFFVGLVVCSGSLCLGAEPSSALPRSSPERQGISSSALLAFVEAADKDIDVDEQLHAGASWPCRGGGLVGAYDAAAPHSLYSLSKSFTSTAVGLAIAEGKAEPRR